MWTKRLSSYYSSAKLDYEIFSYANGLKTRIPKFIKLFPNIREMMIYPYLGRRYLPEIEQQYNVIHFTAAASFAWYQPKVPTVVSVHYLQSRQNSLYKDILPFKYKLIFNPIVNAWIRQLERRAYPNADRIIEAAKQMLPPKELDGQICTRCRVCEEVCPAQAVRCDPCPQFGEGCFLCYNCVRLCEAKALRADLSQMESRLHAAAEKMAERPLSQIFV